MTLSQQVARPWELRLGDCLDPVAGLASLPDKSVDHTITDPPYEEEAHNKGRRIQAAGGAGAGKHSGIMAIKAFEYPPITEAERNAVAAQTTRVTRRWILVFCQSEAIHKWRASYEAAGARYIRTGVYWKNSAQPQYSGDRPGVGWEAIVIFYASKQGRTRWNGGGKCARWVADREFKSALVDGQKPLDLMVQLVNDFTDPGDVIVDPYVGSGTTLLAARMEGRGALGWERKPEHHETARRRLSGEEVRPTPGQRSLFGGTP